MDPFSGENIEKAIQALPIKSNAQLERLLKIAIERDIADLRDAIEAELALRGQAVLDEDAAIRHAKWAEDTVDLDRYETILYAFTKRPPDDDENPLIFAIAFHPGISHAELTEVRGKRGVSLVLGHLVYNRFGSFRHLLATGSFGKQSDILLERSDADGRVAYALQPEAARAFRELKIIPAAG